MCAVTSHRRYGRRPATARATPCRPTPCRPTPCRRAPLADRRPPLPVRTSWVRCRPWGNGTFWTGVRPTWWPSTGATAGGGTAPTSTTSTRPSGQRPTRWRWSPTATAAPARDGHLPPAGPTGRPGGRRACSPRRPARPGGVGPAPQRLAVPRARAGLRPGGGGGQPAGADLPPSGAALHARPHRGAGVRRAREVPGLRARRHAGRAGRRAAHARPSLRGGRAGGGSTRCALRSFEEHFLDRRWEDEARACRPSHRRRLRPDAVAEIQFTSGTTGEPKGVRAHPQHDLVGGPHVPRGAGPGRRRHRADGLHAGPPDRLRLRLLLPRCPGHEGRLPGRLGPDHVLPAGRRRAGHVHRGGHAVRHGHAGRLRDPGAGASLACAGSCCGGAPIPPHVVAAARRSSAASWWPCGA